MRISQSRLRSLIRANQAITSDLDLDSVLHRIVTLAAELVNAEFAGMGVLGPDRQIEKFIHCGVGPSVEVATGRQPEGKGFLRAQIRVRDEIYGNLYLANSRTGSFTPDDVELAEALAATAGIAIENARQFDESIRRERWSRALAEAARGVMVDEEGQQIPRLLELVRDAAQAEIALICSIDDDTDELVVEHVVGRSSIVLATTRVQAIGVSFSQCTGGGSAVLNRVSLVLDTADGDIATQCHLVLVPFAGSERRRTALCVANRGTSPELAEREVEVVRSFTSHVGVVLDRAEVRRTRQQVAMLEDRSRIARDLHDHVIQRLFATGLSLQATAAQVDGAAGLRLSDLVHEIDGAITQIRQSVFALNHDGGHARSTPRARVTEIVERIGGNLSRRPTVVFAGPVDLVTDDDLSHDVEAVVSEALTNAVRHAKARSIDVEIAIVDHSITVSVVDDGVCPGAMTRRSGLSNLELRARRHGGSLVVEARSSGGTALHWSGRVSSPRSGAGGRLL